MNADLLDLLVCPVCGSTTFGFEMLAGSREDIRDGIVWCENRDWFPLEERVLEFLPPALRYHDDRTRFGDKHARELKALDLLETDVAPAGARIPDALDLIQAQKHHFDWYAENAEQAYNSYAAMPFWRIVDDRTFSKWNARIHRELGPGEGVKLLLDVGCAQGRSASLAGQPGVRVIGFDVSKRMVRQAYANLGNNPHGHDFVVADGSRFPFRSGAFDYVLVYGVLHHLPDPVSACHEIVRVLKSGGAYFGSENNRTIFRGVFDLLQRLFPVWHEEAGQEPLMSSEDLRHWFSGTGLTIETSPIVFVPPHLVNALGIKAGGLLVAISDAVLKTIPFVRDQGGLILVEGTKP